MTVPLNVSLAVLVTIIRMVVAHVMNVGLENMLRLVMNVKHVAEINKLRRLAQQGVPMYHLLPLNV